MSWFCSFTLTSYVILLGVAFQSVPSPRRPANEDFRSQTVPDWQLQKLPLVNLGETYQTIPSTKTAEGRSRVQLSLKIGIRLQNISGNHVLAVGTDCFRLVKTLVIPEPLVGRVEEAGGVLTTPEIPGDASPFLNGPVTVKRSEPRNALQPRAQTPHDFIPGFCSA
jgi:hypothetical protein